MEAATTFQEPDEELEGEVPTPIYAAPGDSVLDAVRKRREALAGDRYHDLEVPGYNGCLVLRCGPIDAAKLSQVRDRLTRSGGGAKLDYSFNADIVVDSCREVLGRRRPEDVLESIDPAGEVVRIDERLAELLGVKVTTARDLLRIVYQGAP